MKGQQFGAKSLQFQRQQVYLYVQTYTYIYIYVYTQYIAFVWGVVCCQAHLLLESRTFSILHEKCIAGKQVSTMRSLPPRRSLFGSYVVSCNCIQAFVIRWDPGYLVYTDGYLEGDYEGRRFILPKWWTTFGLLDFSFHLLR